MFEQSILASANPRARLGPLAASLTAQCAAGAVLVLLPLLYTDRLSAVLRDPPLPPILIERPKPPEPRPLPAASGETAGATKTYMVRRLDRLPPSTSRPLSAIEAALAEVTAPPNYRGDLGPPTSVERVADSRPGLVDALPPPVETKPAPPSGPVRVSEGVQAAKLLRRVLPEYPQLAKIARVQGTVQLLGVIAKDGTIQELRVISGHHLLVNAAVAAVRQWVYRPTLLSGQPVEVIAPIEVRFQLAQ